MKIGEGRENFSGEKLFPPFPKPHPSLSKDFCMTQRRMGRPRHPVSEAYVSRRRNRKQKARIVMRAFFIGKTDPFPLKRIH